MDVSSMLGGNSRGQELSSLQPSAEGGSSTPARLHHPYPTRNAGNAVADHVRSASTVQTVPLNDLASVRGVDGRPHGLAMQSSPTTRKQPPKLVTFSLILSESSHIRARLPLRVGINTHDTTESIITTVKNFYGLYEGEGVSFEDNNGNTLIAQYENLTHNAMVYVKVTNEQVKMEEPVVARALSGTSSPRKPPRLDEPFQLTPSQPYSRPSSRTMKKRSPSPTAGAAAISLNGSSSIRSGHIRPKLKTFGSQAKPGDDNEWANGLSDSDAGSVSVSSSRRAKSDQLASAEISLDNIVEGGRRKRAKFESSELPLFAPPQVPITASQSSLSPQRRNPSLAMKSPLPPANHYNFAYNQPLPSPQSYGHADSGFKSNNSFATPASKTQTPQSQVHGHRLRARGSLGNHRLSGGSANGALPTPDPTIGGSVMSDEDVALQLMRLGDASNMSSHGRLSASTMDDALSGKADAASSADESEIADDDDDDDVAVEDGLHAPAAAASSYAGHKHPRGGSKNSQSGQRKKLKGPNSPHQLYDDDGYSSVDDYEDYNDATFKEGEDHYAANEKSRFKGTMKGATSSGKPRSVAGSTKVKSRPSISKAKASKSGGSISAKSSSASLTPGVARANVSSPHGATQQQQQLLATDEEDLSSKPRCQRCRKSKKGCDRQRPCQRCKDAGIGIEGCISEDEGNGRKGRFGRHMGVTIKKGTPGSVTGTATGVGSDFAMNEVSEGALTAAAATAASSASSSCSLPTAMSSGISPEKHHQHLHDERSSIAAENAKKRKR